MRHIDVDSWGIIIAADAPLPERTCQGGSCSDTQVVASITLDIEVQFYYYSKLYNNVSFEIFDSVCDFSSRTQTIRWKLLNFTATVLRTLLEEYSKDIIYLMSCVMCKHIWNSCLEEQSTPSFIKTRWQSCMVYVQTPFRLMALLIRNIWFGLRLMLTNLFVSHVLIKRH